MTLPRNEQPRPSDSPMTKDEMGRAAKKVALGILGVIVAAVIAAVVTAWVHNALIGDLSATVQLALGVAAGVALTVPFWRGASKDEDETGGAPWVIWGAFALLYTFATLLAVAATAERGVELYPSMAFVSFLAALPIIKGYRKYARAQRSA